VDETTAQPKVQQFESTGFQDPQRHLVTNTTVSAVRSEKEKRGSRISRQQQRHLVTNTRVSAVRPEEKIEREKKKKETAAGKIIIY
jgi:hypothetical protein